MKLKVFAIPAAGDENAEAALSLFMAQHRVQQVDRQLIQNGSGSYWSICVGYSEKQAGNSKQQNANRVDYRNVLSASGFRDYSALREWRKQSADNDGIPVFAVFSNEQLAAIVQLSELTLAALRGIEGVGEKKIDRYGKPVLSLLLRRRSESSGTNNSQSQALPDTSDAGADRHET